MPENHSQSEAEKFNWYDPGEKPFVLAGFPWFAQERLYRRLPLKPAWPIPPAVDSLANCTAGGQVRFSTNSRLICLKVALTASSGMYHMPATGQSGFDCYVGPVGQARYLRTIAGQPTDITYQGLALDLPDSAMRVITLNFPLYQGVKELAIGLLPEARIQPPPAYDRPGRIIIYGTSITQGGCASRPGLVYSNILSRRFNYEFINLGFSGSGRGEPEMAKIIAEIPQPLVYILDYEANAGGLTKLRETLPVF
ncbi:MAG: SGNH/GDSL hydrolase family protein, partial [Candidatus Omnitrophica bacterium]|nr:SGNH/GDSL hydrolase family protein [Candidatus Omnitrophota bacterium]